MINLDLLDKAVRQVKRDGPWEVKILDPWPGERFPRVYAHSISPKTMDAIRRVYSELQQ